MRKLLFKIGKCEFSRLFYSKCVNVHSTGTPLCLTRLHFTCSRVLRELKTG